MIKLTICIYATEAQRPWSTHQINQVQAQLNKLNRQDVDAMFYIDKGELSDENKKKWLVDNSNGEYYTFIGYNYDVKKNYVADLLAVLDSGNVGIHELVMAGIFKRIGTNTSVAQMLN